MVLKSDKIRLRKMLSDSITVLCRAGLPFQSKVQVEALIGITLDDSEVVLVSFKETMSSNGLIMSSESADEDDAGDKRSFVIIGSDQKCDPDPVTVKTEYPDVEWDAADNRKRKNRGRRRAKTLGEFGDSRGGERAKASSGVEQDEQFGNDMMDEHTGDIDLDNFDGSLIEDNRVGENFSGEGHRGFRAQIKVEENDGCDDYADDCMIVKSEEPNLTECYEINDNQSWEGQADMFNGSNFQGIQDMGVPSDVMPPTDYDQSWLPQSGKQPPAKKFKLPLQQRRQTWNARPSSTYTKPRNFQSAGKLHPKPTPRPTNTELEDISHPINMEKIKSQKGKTMMVVEGYRYRQDRANADGSTSWRCSKKDGCRGRMKMLNDDVLSTSEHNHAPH